MMNRVREIILLVLLCLALSFTGSEPNAQAGTPMADGFKLLVAFAQPASLQPGAPVYLHGEQIGTVREINLGTTDTKTMNLVLSIDPESSNSIPQGTVALLSSPLELSGTETGNIVDLLPPSSLAGEQGAGSFVSQGEQLNGFTSFENYWRATGR